MRTIQNLAVALLILAGVTVGQTKKVAPSKAAPGADGTAPKFKAVWEPVSFNKDIELRAIACTGPETCWVAGRKSTILFTADGCKSWKAQLGGDTEANDEDLAEIVFLDAKHGGSRPNVTASWERRMAPPGWSWGRSPAPPGVWRSPRLRPA